MSYNTNIILSELLTATSYKVTIETAGLFKNTDDWVKLQRIIKSLPDEESQLLFLSAWISKRVAEDEKEFKAEKEKAKLEIAKIWLDRESKKREEAEKERKTKEEKERKVREEKERKAREDKDRKDREEKERKVREEKERKAREDKDRKDREEKERKAREENERNHREEKDKESSVARHTLFAHYSSGLAFAVPTPGYPGRHLVHIGGGSFIPSAAPIGFIAPGFIPGPCFVRAHRF
jgi:hypothetical protein